MSAGWPPSGSTTGPFRPPTAYYRGVLQARDAQTAAVERDLAPYFDGEPFGDQVHRLAAYRGITHMGALTPASEVCDRRRFARGTQFMGFCGLVPFGHSMGFPDSTDTLIMPHRPLPLARSLGPRTRPG